MTLSCVLFADEEPNLGESMVHQRKGTAESVGLGKFCMVIETFCTKTGRQD